ncbi:MAG: response regulator [Hyphomonadaceae bacterium]|nr:response regulator [Hyphomonadaceae bacterium]
MPADAVVYVVDDDPAMRESIAFLLESAGILARCYDSAEMLLSETSDLSAHGCVVTDIRMPGISGLQLVRELHDRSVLLPIVVITGHADVALAVEAMKAGVVDFLEKPFAEEALLRAVQGALARVEDQAARAQERSSIEARFAHLTAREREVFEAIAAGDSNKEAGRRLGISPRTVEIYRANVMAKMRAQTLSDLVRMALLRSAL